VDLNAHRVVGVSIRCDKLKLAGIATRYGLDGPEIESLLGRDFPHPSRPTLGSVQVSVPCVPDLFPWGKAVWAWRYPPAPI
jgi:hypothetical protein